MTMKKLSYILGCCVALFSCTREIEKIEPETIEYPNVAEVNDLPTNIPSTLIANLAAEDDADTKTAYVDSKSKWVLGDRVCLLYVDDLDTPTRQGWIAYSVTGLENNGRMATFTIVSGQDDKITALSSYHSTGVAIYPSNAARPYTSNTEAIDGDFSNKPFITIQSTQTGNYADVVMLGKTAVVDGSTLTVDFKTAMSILKVSVSDIPAEAMKFQLYSSDADVYPTGDFLIDINADAPLELTKDSYHTWGGGYHSGSQAITINRTSEWDDGEQTFYFNVPTGAYEESSLTLKLLDGSNNPLMEKPIKSAFTFVRNKMITGINLAAEWTTLGNAKFHDMFDLDNVKLDSWNWATTALQRNISNNNQYRLVKPYQAYSTANSYTPLYAPDDYLYFTVNPENDLVSFERHLTGLTFGGLRYIISHTDISGGHKYTQEYSKVVSKDGSGNPLCVQLAPYYLYSDLTNGYSRTDKDGLIIILFPDFDNSCTLSSPNDPDDETVTIKAAGTNISKIKVGISSLSASDAMSMINTTAFASLPGTNDPATGVELSGVTSTGKYYIAVKGYDAGGREIYRNISNIYHITSDDLSAMSGTYYIQNNSSYPLTIAMSTNIFMGNLAFTSYTPWSLTGNIAGNYSGTSFVVDATQVFNQHSNLNYYGLCNPKNANTIDPMTFTVSTVDDKKRLAISGIGVGIASMSGGRATSYAFTSIYFSSSPILYQQ